MSGGIDSHNMMASSFHKDQALELLLHHMDQDTRARFMRELPMAYNDIMGREIVKVVRAEDNHEIRKPPLKGLAKKYAEEDHAKKIAEACELVLNDPNALLYLNREMQDRKIRLLAEKDAGDPEVKA